MPSKNRWGSMSDHLRHQVAGFLLHNIGGIAVANTFTDWQSGDANEAEGDDLRATLRKKAFRLRHYATEVPRRRRATLVLATSVPLDHLWRHLQWIETAGAALLDVANPRHNPFKLACQHYSTMCSVDTREGCFSSLFWEFGSSGDT